MPLRFVVDEHLRVRLPAAIMRHNLTGGLPIDAVQVGDPPDLPRGTPDPELLRWAEREGRILITRDVHTMPQHLADHLAAGRSSPGVFALRPSASMGQIVAFLELAAYAGDPADYADQVTFIP
jgi:hypothetical protein